MADIDLLTFTRIAYATSTRLNLPGIMKYTDNMDMKKIKEYFKENNISDAHDQFYIGLGFALMYECDEMQEFIYGILSEISNDITSEEFNRIVNGVNRDVTKPMIGGFNIKIFFTEFKLIIFIISLALLYTYLSFQIYGMSGKAFELATQIVTTMNAFHPNYTCSSYKQSAVAGFIEKYGHGILDGPTAIRLDKAFQCAKQPNINSELQKQRQQKFNEEMRIVFENNDLLEIQSSEIKLLLGPTTEMHEEPNMLIEYEPNIAQVSSNLEKALIIRKEDGTPDVESTFEMLKTYSDMDPEKFHAQLKILAKVAEPDNDIPKPNNKFVPTSSPTFRKFTDFASDAFAAVKEIIGPLQMENSFSPLRGFSYAIHDRIIQMIHTYEDEVTRIKRDTARKLTLATRLISEFYYLLIMIPLLSGLNVAAFYAILYFYRKFSTIIQEKDAAHGPLAIEAVAAHGPLAIEEGDAIQGPLRPDLQPGARASERKVIEKSLKVQPVGEGSGGRRKRKTIRKQKKKTHKNKRSKKRRQTKARKGRRRITRKY